MSLSGHSQAIRRSVHSRQISCPVTPKCWGITLSIDLWPDLPHLFCPSCCSTLCLTAASQAEGLKQDVAFHEVACVLLQVSVWDSLFTAHARRNSHDSWHFALGIVRGRLPRAEIELSTLLQCRIQNFPCWEGNSNHFSMVSWLLHSTRRGHLIKTSNLWLVHLLVCPRE